MSMQRLLGLGVAFSVLVQGGDKCFKKAAVPFQSVDEATDWVETYCECFEKVLACHNAKCITDLWGYMHDDNDLAITVDGDEVGHWRVWNAKVQKGRVFLEDSSAYTECSLSSYGEDFVVVDETFELFFSLPVPVFGKTKVPYVEMETQQRLTFNADGTFSKKEHNSQGAISNCFKFLGNVNAKNAAASFVGATVPRSIVESFFLDADSGIIVFVSCVVLLMYLALMYTIIRVAALCIRGRKSNSGYEYGKVLDLTSVTEIEDANEKQELA